MSNRTVEPFLGRASLSRLRVWAAFLTAIALVAGCAPRAAPTAPSSDGSGSPAGPRTLRLVQTTESQPDQGYIFVGGGTGPPELTYALHAGLTVYDEKGNVQPRIAERVPTLEDGDWKTFPDGRMEVTWRLRPNVKWHDGTPLTAEDYVFGMRVLGDREIPATRGRAAELVSQVDAPDPGTLVLTWKETYFLANEASLKEVVALPRHILGEPYDRGDKPGLINSAYWKDQFIGLGPYQMEKLELGSHVEVRAFDQYFLGRPKIDRIVFQYRGDPNSVLATLLAGEADMIPVGSFKYSFISGLKTQWEGPGNGSIIASFRGTRTLDVQFRDPTKPWAQDVRVRQGLVHLLDRQTLVDGLLEGSTQVAHTLPAPDQPVYVLLQQKGLAIYPFDQRRAQALLGEAGWTRGPDGRFRSAAGEPMSFELWTSSAKPDSVRETEAIAAQWRETGLTIATYHIPDEAADKAFQKTQFTGFMGAPTANNPETYQKFHSSVIPTEQNRWRGANVSAYNNSAFDQLYDRYLSALQPGPRNELLAQMLKLDADQVLSIYLYYDMATNIGAIRNGLKGPLPVSPRQTVQTWNVHLWELN